MTNESPNPNADVPQEPRIVSVNVQFFTDPLCGWSWAFEAPWRALRWRYPGRIRWCYRMAGLIPKWEGYCDEEANVARPAQMGPHWLYITRTTGQPLRTRLWVNDPPASSMPACLAVKTAALQGGMAAERYLRRLREAIALEERNIAQQGVLLELALECANKVPASNLFGGAGVNFDAAQFEHDWFAETAKQDLREDLRETRYLQIQQLPALILHGPAAPPFIVSGYRTLPQLERALAHAAGGMPPHPRQGSIVEFLQGWPACTAAEIATAVGKSIEEVDSELAALATGGELTQKDHLYFAGKNAGLAKTF